MMGETRGAGFGTAEMMRPDRPLRGEPIADVPYEPSSIDAVSFCRGDSINDIYTYYDHML
jgi:hypothetical protein